MIKYKNVFMENDLGIVYGWSRKFYDSVLVVFVYNMVFVSFFLILFLFNFK